MKFSLEALTNANHIHSYDDNEVVITKNQTRSGFNLDHPLVITADDVMTSLELSDMSVISNAHVAYLLTLNAEIIIFAISTPSALQKQLIRFHHQFVDNHVGVEVMKQGAAFRTFNLLITEGRKVVLVTQ
jgi:uncharacterized protein